jgi:hypothetical protein
MWKGRAALQKRVYGQKKRFSGVSSSEARRHQAGSTPGSPPEDHVSHWQRRIPGRYEQPTANRATQWREPVGCNDMLPDGIEAFPRVDSQWTGPAWARCPGTLRFRTRSLNSTWRTGAVRPVDTPWRRSLPVTALLGIQLQGGASLT